MRDKELYEQILGLEQPWRVVGVELDTGGREVRVEIENEQRRLPCPVCGVECPRHDNQHRHWRHLDTCQFQTILVAAVPRVKCRRHGVKQVPVPWAERGSRFTALFEMLVIAWHSVPSSGGVPVPSDLVHKSHVCRRLNPSCCRRKREASEVRQARRTAPGRTLR